MTTRPRLAVRAIILRDNRLLLVNAYPSGISDLWCAPGGGVEAGTDLPGNLAREVHEETGLTVRVGAMIGANEFHDPGSDFHQIDLFFRATILSGDLQSGWRDPENVVTERRFVTERELATLRHKPDTLPRMAFGDVPSLTYDGLEPIIR